MVIIDQSRCNACGLCTKICHEYCLRLNGDILTIDYKFCSSCTQCIAVCPEQALTWDHIRPEKFNTSIYPGPEQLAELFKERRTIRDFTNQKIDKLLLEEIAGYAIYAPTHDFNLRVIIIDDDRIIHLLDSIILKFSKNLYKWIYRTGMIHFLLKVFTPDLESEFLQARPKLEIALKRNAGLKTKPAAILMVIGNKKVPLSLESAQYALYNIDLYAQTKGIACRNLVGNQMTLNRNKKFKKLIGLKRSERINGTLLLGYPAIKFRNKVLGKQIPIQWNAMKNQQLQNQN
jgi:NAD-dependent dihydropyrimidine dehydrogenase PreA subunit/nitroreductase